MGQILVRQHPIYGRLAARIVETEAYGPEDPASHAFRGQTKRNSCMFGEPGHLYVYFTYGMHFCMNAVTDEVGRGSAVLLRAGEPIDGLESMAGMRGRDAARDLCSGPAKWCQAFAVDRDLNCADLVDGDVVWVERGTKAANVLAGPRVGVSSGADSAWRFHIAGNEFVSRRSPGTRTAPRPSKPTV